MTTCKTVERVRSVSVILIGLLVASQLVDVLVPHSQQSVATGNVDVYAQFRRQESASSDMKFSLTVLGVGPRNVL